MTSIALKKESLEERLERIRKKNEEIEKKHQEAERDRLIAKAQNAMVEIRPSALDDWPREHKYDKLDITYDVPESQLEAEKAAKLEQQQRRATKAARFTDIPPDPNSFLADEERDGVQREKKLSAEKPQGRGRQIVGRKKFPQKSVSQEFPEQNGQLVNRRKSQPDDPAIAEMERNFDSLTVSVSQDGDFKSVRLTQTPIIGSGRVGPRQITKTQFQPMVQQQQQQQQQQQFVPPPQQPVFDKNAVQRKSERRRPKESQAPKRSSSFKATSPGAVISPIVPVVPATGIGLKPFSVQDRLKRAVEQNASCANNNKNMILNIISANEIIAAEDRNRASNA